jgi:hypothetical protein
MSSESASDSRIRLLHAAFWFLNYAYWAADGPAGSNVSGRATALAVLVIVIALASAVLIINHTFLATTVAPPEVQPVPRILN